MFGNLREFVERIGKMQITKCPIFRIMQDNTIDVLSFKIYDMILSKRTFKKFFIWTEKTTEFTWIALVVLFKSIGEIFSYRNISFDSDMYRIGIVVKIFIDKVCLIFFRGII